MLLSKCEPHKRLSLQEHSVDMVDGGQPRIQMFAQTVNGIDHLLSRRLTQELLSTKIKIASGFNIGQDSPDRHSPEEREICPRLDFW